MQIPCSLYQLIDNLFHSFFWQTETPFCNIVEQIFALHVLHHNKVVLISFKQIDQVYYVGMLTHFKHFNFSSLLVNFNLLHISLHYGLNSNFLSRFFAGRKFNNAKLTLTQIFCKVVKFIYVLQPNCLPDFLRPLFLYLFTFKVNYS